MCWAELSKKIKHKQVSLDLMKWATIHSTLILCDLPFTCTDLRKKVIHIESLPRSWNFTFGGLDNLTYHTERSSVGYFKQLTLSWSEMRVPYFVRRPSLEQSLGDVQGRGRPNNQRLVLKLPTIHRCDHHLYQKTMEKVWFFVCLSLCNLIF